MPGRIIYDIIGEMTNMVKCFIDFLQIQKDAGDCCGRTGELAEQMCLYGEHFMSGL